MPDVACPADDRLAVFARGELSSADLESLALHLEACQACQRRLALLDAQPNPLLSALRGEPLTVDWQRRGDPAGPSPAPSPAAAPEPPARPEGSPWPGDAPQPAPLAPRLDSDIRNLLYQRLRIFSLTGIVPLTILFGLTLTDLNPLINRFTVGGMPRQLFGLTAALFASAALWLRLRPTLSLPSLRAIEVGCHGLVVACVSAWQYATLTRALPESFDGPQHLATHYSAASFLATFLWVLVIVAHAIAIPNTLRRTLVLAFSEAVLALLLLTAAGLVNPAVGTQLPVLMPLAAAMLSVALALAIFGTFKISTLQQEAIEARRLGQYRLKQKLGAGGMGEVYLAEHRLLKRPCAVKLIRPERARNPELLTRFEREVHATAQLTHGNTVEVYDYGRTEDGTFYYVMEYLAGLTLQELVHQYGPLPPARAVHFLRQLCGALSEAHDIGLVHRDLKPGNVMVCKYAGRHDVAKLLDFGLVRVVHTDPASPQLTRQGVVLGTPEYLSPEQAGGEGADLRSDLYSLGALAYFLLTGQPPFPRRSVAETLQAQIKDPAPPLKDHYPGVPATLEAIVQRCLAKDPAERFADARSLDDALARCAGVASWTEGEAAAWWQAHNGARA